jgi:hypothetical protein
VGNKYTVKLEKEDGIIIISSGSGGRRRRRRTTRIAVDVGVREDAEEFGRQRGDAVGSFCICCQSTHDVALVNSVFSPFSLPRLSFLLPPPLVCFP